MTALGDKLKAAGFDAGRTRLIATWQKAHKEHGDKTRRIAEFWHVVLRHKDLQVAAATLLDELMLTGKGRLLAANHFVIAADQHQLIRGEGPSSCEPQLQYADSANKRGGQTFADNRLSNAPSQTQRAANIGAAITIYDSYKLEDGTPIGDVKMTQIPALKARYVRHASLLDMIYKHAKPSDPMASVRECVSDKHIIAMIQKAAEVQDEAA